MRILHKAVMLIVLPLAMVIDYLAWNAVSKLLAYDPMTFGQIAGEHWRAWSVL